MPEWNDDSDGSGPSTPGDMETMNTSSLQALQSSDQRRVMDMVDKLRRIGLSGLVELPQLVVCGDQSSGKSSVLEAITEIPFPRKENLCTRFATEIILRRSPASESIVTINPDKQRPEEERTKLSQFRKSITDFNELPEVIEDATHMMGLGAVGGINSRAFSRDVLSIEIKGPNRPHLTLVDLPGLIHSTNKSQTEADKELILNLVKQYMSNSRTIILAVVSAKNDYANQIILDYCRKIDEKGRRTLGIITKPDFLREGTENELSWIGLAQNKDIYLQLGWHMLKNREDNQMNFSFAERNASETLFFNKGRFADLPRNCVGIESLRIRLSKVLLTHLIRELPSLRAEMDDKLQATIKDIEKLGKKRDTIHEQRVVLTDISVSITEILRAATKGHYEADFFGAIDMEAEVDASENIRRFRGVVQHVNIKFANDMRIRGHKYSFEAGPGDDEKEAEEDMKAQKDLDKLVEDDDMAVFLPKPKQMSREAAVAWVKKILERYRGCELPGTFQPMLISALFREQSQPWEKIASEHVNKVARTCKTFVYMILEDKVPPEFKDKLTLKVDAALTASLNDAKEELVKLLEDEARHPSTYNHYFTTNIQKMRQRKHQKIASSAREEADNEDYDDGVEYTKLFHDAFNKAIEQDMDTFSSGEALDTQRAYYKDELKYFVNAIAKAVIERHLVEPLPRKIFSPNIVADMTEKEIHYIAAEPMETTQERLSLEARKSVLENGLDTFMDAMGGLRR